LVVTMPPVPPHRDLRRLCTILLSSTGDGSAANGESGSKRLEGGGDSHDRYDTVQDLIAATGGTRASAIKWCQQYLHPGHRKQHH
jgi:hypothetical protein